MGQKTDTTIEPFLAIFTGITFFKEFLTTEVQAFFADSVSTQKHHPLLKTYTHPASHTGSQDLVPKVTEAPPKKSCLGTASSRQEKDNAPWMEVTGKLRIQTDLRYTVLVTLLASLPPFYLNHEGWFIGGIFHCSHRWATTYLHFLVPRT